MAEEAGIEICEVQGSRKPEVKSTVDYFLELDEHTRKSISRREKRDACTFDQIRCFLLLNTQTAAAGAVLLFTLLLDTHQLFWRDSDRLAFNPLGGVRGPRTLPRHDRLRNSPVRSPSELPISSHPTRIGYIFCPMLFQPLVGLFRTIPNPLRALLRNSSPLGLPVSSHPIRSSRGRAPTLSAKQNVLLVILIPLIVLAFENIKNYSELNPAKSHGATNDWFLILTFNTLLFLLCLCAVTYVAWSTLGRGGNALSGRSLLLLVMGSFLFIYALMSYRSFLIN